MVKVRPRWGVRCLVRWAQRIFLIKVVVYRPPSPLLAHRRDVIFNPPYVTQPPTQPPPRHLLRNISHHLTRSSFILPIVGQTLPLFLLIQLLFRFESLLLLTSHWFGLLIQLDYPDQSNQPQNPNYSGDPPSSSILSQIWRRLRTLHRVVTPMVEQ